eukprot:scaffold94276_cov57-Phaeocystis_antarctica.AAC.3
MLACSSESSSCSQQGEDAVQPLEGPEEAQHAVGRADAGARCGGELEQQLRRLQPHAAVCRVGEAEDRLEDADAEGGGTLLGRGREGHAVQHRALRGRARGVVVGVRVHEGRHEDVEHGPQAAHARLLVQHAARLTHHVLRRSRRRSHVGGGHPRSRGGLRFGGVAHELHAIRLAERHEGVGHSDVPLDMPRGAPHRLAWVGHGLL